MANQSIEEELLNNVRNVQKETRRLNACLLKMHLIEPSDRKDLILRMVNLILYEISEELVEQVFKE